MKFILIAGFLVSCFVLSSCSSGTRSDDTKVNDIERYREVFEEDPKDYVDENTSNGDFRYWGFRQRSEDQKLQWIPGITGRVHHGFRVDVVTVGLEVDDQTTGAAASFFKSYNLIMKKKRAEALKSGKKLDVYWRLRD